MTRGASPFTGACSIASTAAIPSTTRPNTGGRLVERRRIAVTMKNDVVALAGLLPRAIDTNALDVLRIVELGR